MARLVEAAAAVSKVSLSLEVSLSHVLYRLMSVRDLARDYDRSQEQER